MTVRGRTVKRNQRIKRMLTECYPISAIARFSHISETRVRQIKDSFLASGELMEVPGSWPILYIDPHAHALGTELPNNGGGAENDGVAGDRSRVYDSLPPNGKLPFGMTNAHIPGRISMTVRKKGDFGDVKGPNGLYVGFWTKPRSGGKGKTYRKCRLSLFRQEITVDFYESVKGTPEFYVNPGRVYYYPAKVSQNRVVDYFLERAVFVANLLKGNGWDVTGPQLPRNFQLHHGKEGDPLAAIIPPRYHSEGQDIISDTSPEYLETELEHATDEEIVKIYANMPSRIYEHDIEIGSMKREIIGLREVVKLQGEVIREAVSNISELTKGVTQLTTVEASAMARRFSEFTGEGYQ